MANEDRLRNASAMLVFAEVVRHGTFSGAAKKLGLAKSSVSREVSDLERRLGAQLLRRTTRKMSLTEVGEAFFARCERVAEEAEAAELSVHRLQAEPVGEIRLAAPMSFGHEQLVPRLPEFLDAHPKVRIDVDLTDRTIDLVREKFDLAVRIGAKRPREQTLVVRRLATLRLMVCAAPSYLEAHGAPERPEDLEHHNCLGYQSPPETWNFSDGVSVRTSGSLNADNGDALRNAALQGFGVTYLPTFIVGDDVRAGRLVPLLVEQTRDRTGELMVVYPESRHLSPKVRTFIDWLADSIGTEPCWDEGLPLA